VKAIDLFEEVVIEDGHTSEFPAEFVEQETGKSFYVLAAPDTTIFYDGRKPGYFIIPVYPTTEQQLSEQAETLLLAAASVAGTKGPGRTKMKEIEMVVDGHKLRVWHAQHAFVKPTRKGESGLAVLNSSYVGFAE